MIPYFRITTIPLGPVDIQAWGLFVALGIGTALLLGRRLAAGRGLDKEKFTDLASWTVLGALVGGRLFHALAYEPATYLADPLAFFRLWEGGMSMFGGLVGGAGAIAWYSRRARLPFLRYADLVAFVLPLGYGIGRIGCFLIHDHPGTLSHSFIAVRYPDGARLDHGLLLSLVGFSLFAIFSWRARRGMKTGFLPLFMVCYGTARFVLDFFRATDIVHADARYIGLTPAQFLSVALVISGAALWRLHPAYAIPPERRS